MIGHLTGTVIFSDGRELILSGSDGVGHQMYYAGVLPEGKSQSFYITHIIRENAQELYAFDTLKLKKIFELLLTVKGVGPKSAYALLCAIPVDRLILAIKLEDKKALSQAPGVGAKTAAQIVLDLASKIQKMEIYLNGNLRLPLLQSFPTALPENMILKETLSACLELGFKEEVVGPLARKILDQNGVQRAEQLVHLVLKEL